MHKETSAPQDWKSNGFVCQTIWFCQICFSPDCFDFICSEPLGECRILQCSRRTMGKFKETGISYHCTIINAVPIISGKQPSTTFWAHCSHHFLQAFIAAYTPNNKNIFCVTMSHGSLSYLHQHGKQCLLQHYRNYQLTNFHLFNEHNCTRYQEEKGSTQIKFTCRE